METALESKIIDNPDRFRGSRGNQGAQGKTWYSRQWWCQGNRGNRGAGFWEDSGRAKLGLCKCKCNYYKIFNLINKYWTGLSKEIYDYVGLHNLVVLHKIYTTSSN